MYRAIMSVAAVLLLGVLGCGGGSETYDVSGAVTLDGQPVKEGDIIFEASDGSIGSDAGKIIDGKYSLEVKPGRKKVVIRSQRKVPGKSIEGAMGENLDETEEAIPARYNESTELTAEVGSSSDNTFDFPLRSTHKAMR